jgi:hypothetical protein
MWRREELGLMREARPYIFEDVVNKMEQRLTLFQQAGVHNVVIPHKPVKREDGGEVGKNEGNELDPIPEGPQGGDEPSNGRKYDPKTKGLKHDTNVYLDNYGIMISLPDPVKVRISWLWISG